MQFFKPSLQEMNALAALFTERRYTEAAALAQTMTERFPLHGFGWNALGMVLQQLGQNADALLPMQKAAALSPDNADAHYNLGLLLHELGRLDEAEASYRRTLQIKPGDAEVRSSLGNVLQELGRLDEAEASYRRAIQIKSDYLGAHYNLSIVLKDMGRLDEAEASCRRALEIKPDFVEVLNHLALLLYTQGNPMLALNIVLQSLRAKETDEAKSVFVACVKRLRFAFDDNEIREAMVRALTEPWGRPGELARISADLVKLNPEIGECISRANNAWPLRLSAQDLFGPNHLTAIASDPLLNALLGSAPICDIEMERFLTMARCALLEAATGMSADGTIGAALSFYSALAHQCFINEYVFSYTADEIQKANSLRELLTSALETNSQAPVMWLAAVATYFPLCSIPLSFRLLDSQWPTDVSGILVQQVREPEEEQQLRTTIPKLTDIEDEVSLLVQRQYEENPYPRWIKAAPAGKAKNILGYLRQKLPLATVERHSKGNNIDALIAGCGTGQHSIQLARLFQGAQVLAVDLSISSLGYAKRKTRELGLDSIEYAQADLLKLGSLNRSFDIIESAGVLHHLSDPWAGWRVLLSLLRPGGFMMLGFYSEVARRNIVKARSFIAEHGYGATANEIRRCRQDLMNLDNRPDFGNALTTADFFSISTCRDLLFHVQEHRMTLSNIEEFLRDNKLKFLGFEIESDVLQAYKQRFSDDHAATNLSQWQIYENENPDTFFGMYQFWMQKAS